MRPVMNSHETKEYIGLFLVFLAKVNKRLGLLKRIKHLLPRHARVLYYNSLVQPLFDYGDLVWGDNNCTLMQNLQIRQNKAAKVMLDRPPFKSS